jgi:hypothetical protein
MLQLLPGSTEEEGTEYIYLKMPEGSINKHHHWIANGNKKNEKASSLWWRFAPRKPQVKET